MDLNNQISGPLPNDSQLSVLDFPLEILCRIFRFCVPEDKFKRPSIESAPLLLCRVCRYWKDAAWNEPTLWTRPQIKFAGYPGTNEWVSLAMRKTVKLYVERAQDATLDLSVIERPSDAPPHWQIVESWMEDLMIVQQTICRCRELSLLADSSGWIDFLEDTDSKQFASLQAICLRALSNHTPARSFDISSAPRLRYGRFVVAAPSTLSRIALPFTHMESLDCDVGFQKDRNLSSPYEGLSMWRSFVSKCVNLRNISLYLHGFNFTQTTSISNSLPFSPSREKITFALAKSLSIRITFDAALTTIVRGFTFLILDQLELSAIGGSMTLVEEFESLLENLKTNLSFFFGLTTLRLLRVTISNSDLSNLFRSTPLLTFLDIMLRTHVQHMFRPNDADLVECLLIHQTHIMSPILPRLRDLRLYYCQPEESIMTENVTRYADLAISRYGWAKTNIANRDEGVPTTKLPETLPTYPFRLYLVFESDDFDYKSDSIRHAVPKTEYPIFFPERCTSFGDVL